MCKDVLNLVCTMDRRNLELQMALQCAPTITGIKISNLLTIPKSEEQTFRRLLSKSSLAYYYMSGHKGNVTYLVYRRCDLMEYLSQPEVTELLIGEGYEPGSLGRILRRFHERYEAYLTGEGSGFPHEIGILLGYSIEDVVGFIEHEGRDYLYSGYWKVYRDVDRKKEIFQDYESSKENLIRMIAANISICSIIKMYEDRQPLAAAV